MQYLIIFQATGKFVKILMSVKTLHVIKMRSARTRSDHSNAPVRLLIGLAKALDRAVASQLTRTHVRETRSFVTPPLRNATMWAPAFNVSAKVSRA